MPADTLLVVSVPDCTRLQALAAQSAFGKLWADPAMRPFREHVAQKWREEFVSPLERELGVRFANYTNLFRGQLTLAITQEGWQGDNEQGPGLVVLLDAAGETASLERLLGDLRQQWQSAGKPVRAEKIRDAQFYVVSVGSNDVPRTLRQFFPRRQPIRELGREAEPPAGDAGLVVGRAQSLLIAGNSVKVVGKILSRLSNGGVPPLAEQAAFAASRVGPLRHAQAFVWLNAQPLFERLARQPPEPPNPQAPNPLPLPPAARWVPGLGLNHLKSAALTVRLEPDGIGLELRLATPEATRAGLLKLVAPARKDSSPPPFVPAEVASFWRWRLDPAQTLGAFEQMLSEVFPQQFNTWTFLLSSGEEAVKQEQPDYNLRRDVFGNLGDDLLLYRKNPGTEVTDGAPPPALLLIGSPQAATWVRALRGLLVLRTGDALQPKTREFLGRTIYTVSLPGAADARGGPAMLHYAAHAGYVAFSTDAALLEEFLRSGENRRPALAEWPGLAEAAQKVGGLNSGWFAYEDLRQTMARNFELWKRNLATTNSTLGLEVITGSLPYARPQKSVEDWFDYSLLPEFERVARYFYCRVAAGSADAEGLSFKWYWVAPPGLKP
ncbi:MAG: hypothetical protein RMK20_05995 [Verrucomicrobiales bacterium]|nr:hypothetical protein [Verrucomicrobiales bacterium]